jgi:hypothetical protein
VQIMQCYVPPVAILDTKADVFQFLATHGVLGSEFFLTPFSAARSC